MIYLKVKPQFDNTPISYDPYDILVANELYTPDEVVQYRIPMKCLDVVEREEKDTYWLFGARFSD